MFTNKNVIITGGSSGIGEGLAKRLFKQGANIALVARDAKKLTRVKDEMLAAGGAGKVKTAAQPNVAAFSCDVTDYQATIETMKRLADEFGTPDFLFNFAGILNSNYFENLPVEDFRAQMETNFFGTLHFIKAALPYMKGRKGARIINMSSVSGIMGVFGYSSYCASKFAVVGLSDSLRLELKPQGIEMHLILPPEIDTPMVDGIRETRPLENVKYTHSAGVLSVDEAIDDILSGMSRGSYAIIPGKKAEMIVAANRFLPGASRFFADKIIKSCYKGPGGKGQV
ncbi:MAG: SDR family oxidoreductase [bacterium]